MNATDETLYDIKARVIAVLANPKRLEIIDLLAARERTVSDLAAALGLAQAATSQHLATMRKAGVVETQGGEPRALPPRGPADRGRVRGDEPGDPRVAREPAGAAEARARGRDGP